MTHNPTDKPIHKDPTSHASNLNQKRVRNDIVRKTSFQLPSLSGLEQIPLLPPLEKQKREATVPLNEREEATSYTSSSTTEQETYPPDLSRDTQATSLHALPLLPTTETRLQTVPARPAQKTAMPSALPFSNNKVTDQTTTSIKRIRLRSFTPVLLLCIVALVAFVYTHTYTTTQENRPISSNGSASHNQQQNNPAPETRSFLVGAHPSLTVKSHSGNVSISADSSNTVTVKTSHNGKTDSNNEAIQYTQSRNQQGHDLISITTQPPYRNVNYDVKVPNTTQVNIEVDSGSISTYGVSGVNIDTNSGSITVENVNGPVKASTENGNITIRNIKGQVALEISSGSIQGYNINGKLKAITQHGNVEIRQTILSDQSLLKTTDGSLHFTGTIDPIGTYTLETLHGNIDLALPTNTIFQLQASIGSGSLYNEFENNNRASIHQPLILASTKNGSVSVKRAD